MYYKKKTQLKAVLMSAALVISVLAQTGAAEAKAAKKLVPMGCTIGIQMFTDGVLVVGLSATENGTAPSPAAVAGILPGDLIQGLGAEKITCANDFKAAVGKLTGQAVSVTVQRNSEKLQLTLTPNIKSGTPELGVWLRDNVAGVGTMTFYDPQTGLYGGLGHGINDMDSGVIMPLGRGSIFRSTVVDIKKGSAGVPGELHGDFSGQNSLGTILKNTRCGIFGSLSSGQPEQGDAIETATENEIKLGKATVLANISGSEVSSYAIEITRVYRGSDDSRSLMLSVTDEKLLEQTGGIVQGMSGSPIIQNGKLIGAVTHVLVNDPTKGFGVSIEKMLAETGDILLDKAA